MYQGYRIKVNGHIIENTMITKGSYYSTPTRRVVASYYDAAGGFHEELSPAVKMEIGFTIREHDMEEHTALLSAFSTGRNVTAEYWNDATGSYATSVFRVENLKVPHKYALKERILYGAISVKLKEN